MSDQRPAFSRGAVAALVAGGFALFLALALLMDRGESALADTQNGAGHAAANGLNGYSGLARLLAASGYDITRSRSPGGLETRGVLVLTPPLWSDPEELGELLDKRRMIGPTLVIVPKWRASLPPGNLPREAADKFKRGWVVLGGAQAAEWPTQLPPPYRFTHSLEELGKEDTPEWLGFERAGKLPTRTILHTADNPGHDVLIEDAAGHPLAVLVRDAPGTAYNDDAHWLIMLAEPDLANNWGLADPARAGAALALIGELDYDTTGEVTFDLTLHGFGASENLLTLAFRPPFLAATLCLILALAIVFWRAMLRFGPAAASGGPAVAFGKQQLVMNGAGLIMRARRWRLLAQPYAALSARRIARRLGLARHDAAAIDAALAVRLPGEEPFSRRTARLEAAANPAEILSAADALDNLARKLKP
jgi:hypothetical protein